MAETLFAFTTTAGKTWSKKEDTSGNTYYTGPPEATKGNGRVDPEQFSGANQSLSRVLTEVDGETPREIREATSASELENVTQIPFTDDTLFTAVAEEKKGKTEALRAERNRFQGFWDRQADDPDRDEAAERYLEFRNELAGVDDPQARAVIKDSYNIGGS